MFYFTWKVCMLPFFCLHLTGKLGHKWLSRCGGCRNRLLTKADYHPVIINSCWAHITRELSDVEKWLVTSFWRCEMADVLSGFELTCCHVPQGFVMAVRLRNLFAYDTLLSVRQQRGNRTCTYTDEKAGWFQKANIILFKILTQSIY